MDFHSKQENTSPFIDTPDYTFTLPDLSIHDEDFRKFLEKDLIECATLNSLEQSQKLNWWVDIGLCRKIWPLSTSGVSLRGMKEILLKIYCSFVENFL